MDSPGTGRRNLFGRFFGIVSDARFLQILGQIVFIILVVFALSALVNQILAVLASRNLTPTFTFLQNRAGFAIGGAEGYSPDDSYWAAYNVGLRNTLSVVAIGLAGTTVLGIVAGVFLLSSNWLIRNITRFIVEILRNTPLLVQIFAWYFVVILSFPPLQQSLQIPQAGLLALPLRFAVYLIAALIVWRQPQNRRAGAAPALLALAAAVEIGFAYFYNTLDAERNLYGRGIVGAAGWFYLVVSIVALAAPSFLNIGAARRSLWGALGGQFVGGLLFLYGLAPEAAAVVELKPFLSISNRGLVYPEVHATARFGEWFLFAVIGITVALLLWGYLGRITEQTGRPYPRGRYALLSIVLFAVIGWFVVGAEPLPASVPVDQNGTVAFMPLEQARSSGVLSAADQLQYASVPIVVTLPERAGLRFSSGEILDPRYLALLLALVIYTAAFIAEIVRAGILAVPHGQIEAARALGLGNQQVLTLVVLPQALRVIIPPLGNQYLNLAKNSSLALAIAFSDIYAVMYTVINQTGQSITGILIIMLSYLVLSLTIAGVMNWINRRFQLVTR